MTTSDDDTHHDPAVRLLIAQAEKRAEQRVLSNVADRLADWEFPPGSDALEPMHRLVASLRGMAEAGEPDA